MTAGTQQGRSLPYGNSPATALRGQDLASLALLLSAYPEIMQKEIMDWFLVYCEVPGRLFSASQITEAEDRLDLTRNRSSTDARQQDSANNVWRRHHFFASPYPLGVNGRSRMNLIDVDDRGDF